MLYFMVVYFLSFLMVLVLGGYELYKDIKRDVGSLTWGVLVGFLLSLIIPVMNTLVGLFMLKAYLGDFFYELSILMDKPIFEKKSNMDK